MVKWNACAVRGWDHDTWHGGRFFEQWADSRVVKELRNAFSHYDEDDIWKGLSAKIELFRWIAKDTADRLGLSYPTAADGHVAKLIQALYSDRT